MRAGFDLEAIEDDGTREKTREASSHLSEIEELLEKRRKAGYGD